MNKNKMSDKNGVLIVNVDPDGGQNHPDDVIKTIISTTTLSPPQKNKNITKVNLDYNDNKTIIQINGDGGGEIFWSANGYEQQTGGKHLNGNGHIWIDDATSRNSHDSDHGSSSINSSNIEERHLDHDYADADDDDENGGGEFNLSDSEFEEILDEHDDEDDGNVDKNVIKDDENYHSCDDSAITEDIKNTSNTDNDDDDNEKNFQNDDDKIVNGQNIDQQILSTQILTTTENIGKNSFSSINDDDDKNDNHIDNKSNNIEVNISTNRNNNSVNVDGDSQVMIVNGGDGTKIPSKMSSQSSIVDCDNKNNVIMDDSNIELVNETVNVSLVNRSSESSSNVQPNRISRQVSQDYEDREGSNVSGSRRQSIHHHSHLYPDDDQEDGVFVDIMEKANEIAEARLAARRQARAEAREIRMRELERQQKEQENNADRAFDMSTNSIDHNVSRTRISALSTPTTAPVRGNSMSSRRSSEDSLEEEGRSLRDLRHELKDVEERFRKAMIANAQSDNERSAQSYQIQLLKDKLEEMEEVHSQLQREYKEKCRDHDALKRNNDKLGEELRMVQAQLNERDTLIAEQGLVIVIVEEESGTDAKRALVSVENAHLLESTQGSLDVRLKQFAEEKKQLQQEVQQLQQQLLDARSQGRRSGSVNGPLGDDDYEDAQRESNKLIADYKYKLQKAEQEIASLQASLARSETQVIRYKSTAEAAEKAEAELKIERRKLQRENREASERLEELETSNNHLLKRLDKLKNAKSALLKEL